LGGGELAHHSHGQVSLHPPMMMCMRQDLSVGTCRHVEAVV